MTVNLLDIEYPKASILAYYKIREQILSNQMIFQVKKNFKLFFLLNNCYLCILNKKKKKEFESKTRPKYTTIVKMEPN